MSNSKATAEKIVERLESMTDRGFKRTFGGLRRKEFAAIVSDLGDIIDGKELAPYVVPVKTPKEPKAPAVAGTGGSKAAAGATAATGKAAAGATAATGKAAAGATAATGKAAGTK